MDGVAKPAVGSSNIPVRRLHALTYVFITHDLAVARGIADRVSVFQKGRLVESGATADIFAAPRNDYTRRLLAAIPVVTAEEVRFRERFRGVEAESAGQDQGLTSELSPRVGRAVALGNTN